MIFQFDLTKTLDNMEKNIYVFEDPEKYDRATLHHPFYMEMVEEIKKKINLLGVKKPNILEIGCGPGPLTQFLITLPYSSYHAIEPDEMEYRYCLEKFQAELDSNFKLFNCSIQDFNINNTYDVIVTSFVDHHIHQDEKLKYYKKIMKMLHSKGKFIAGEELIGKYTNDDQRKLQLIQYHGYIIKTCIEESHFDMAEIETRALKNGIENWDEFKISVNEYLKYLSAAGFQLVQSKKIGPRELKEAGIYVVSAQKEVK